MSGQLRGIWKCFVTRFALLLALVEMSADVFGVRSLRLQMNTAKFASKQRSVGDVNVVLVLFESPRIGRTETALIAGVRLCIRMAE